MVFEHFQNNFPAHKCSGLKKCYEYLNGINLVVSALSLCPHIDKINNIRRKKHDSILFGVRGPPN